MNYSEIWLTFAPKEFLEITDFLEKIWKNNPNDLEVAMKSREKILEIQEKVLENNFIFQDFEIFVNAEWEKFFTENPILDEKNKEIIENFFEEKFLEMKKYIRESEITREQRKMYDIILDLLSQKHKK